MSSFTDYLGRTVCFKANLAESSSPQLNLYLDGTAGRITTVNTPFPLQNVSRWLVERAPAAAGTDQITLRCMNAPDANVYLDFSPGVQDAPILSADNSAPTTWWNLSVDNGTCTLYCRLNDLGLYLATAFYGGSIFLSEYQSMSGSVYTTTFVPPITGEALMAGQTLQLRPYCPGGKAGEDFYLNGSSEAVPLLWHSYESNQTFWTAASLGDQAGISLSCAASGSRFLHGNSQDRTVSLAADSSDNGAHWIFEQNPTAPWHHDDGVYRLTCLSALTTPLAPLDTQAPQDGSRLQLLDAGIDWIVTIKGIVPEPGNYSLSSFTAPGLESVVYRGMDNHLHQLFRQDSSWYRGDLTQLSGTGLTRFGATACFGGTYQKVAYTTTDGHVRLLEWDPGANSWGGRDLGGTTAQGSSLTTYAVGDILGIVYPSGSDGHIHLLSYDGGWQNYDLTVLSGAPDFMGKTPVVSYIYNGYQTVAYLAQGGSLHLMVNTGGGWADYALGSIFNVRPGSALAGAVSGDPHQFIFYIQADGYLHAAFNGGDGWTDSDLSYATGINPAPDTALTAYTAPGNVTVCAFIGADGHLHQAYYANGWASQDLTALTGAPLPAPDTSLTSYTGTAPRQQMIVYADRYGHVHEMAYTGSGTQWSDRDLTAVAG